jgi:hypothetical protein
MQNQPSPFVFFARVGMLGLLGFAVVILAGPLIGIIATILPFVLIGFVAWCLIQLLHSGPRATWQTLREACRFAGAVTAKVAHGFGRVFTYPAQSAVRVYHASRQLAGKAWRGTTAGAKMAVEGGVVTLSGAGIGLVVGLITSATKQDREFAVPTNIAIGAALAAGVWVVMTVMARRRVTVQPAKELASKVA